ncbi:coatomer subunit epsilon [Parus major]|uniref:coatomer subunit epsilon n=1 Tax=Parus major TaxID=9157 RepID=UPI001443BFE4|nr:coatomer subunit epsilon [Parus major]
MAAGTGAAPPGEADELFDLRNNFYIGAYQAAINEAQRAKPSSPEKELERDVFLFRAYIAQVRPGWGNSGNPGIVWAGRTSLSLLQESIQASPGKLKWGEKPPQIFIFVLKSLFLCDFSHFSCRKELKKMQEQDEDATLTQLATAWVNLAMGGEKLQEAFYTFQELAERACPTLLLLSGQAVAAMAQGRWDEAEGLLQEALDKENDFDRLALQYTPSA